MNRGDLPWKRCFAFPFRRSLAGNAYQFLYDFEPDELPAKILNSDRSFYLLSMTDLKTEKGVKFICYARMGSLLIGFAILILLGVMVAGVESDPMGYGGLGNSLGRMCLPLLTLGLLVLLVLSLLVLEIVGIVYIYKGRKEFTQRHKKSVKKAVLLMIIGAVISLIPLANIIGSIMIALGGIFLIVSIARPVHRSLLWFSFGLDMIITCISLLFQIVYYTSNTMPDIPIGFFIVLLVLGMIPPLLVLVAYFGTLNGIRNGMIEPLYEDSFQGLGLMPPPAYYNRYPPSVYFDRGPQDHHTHYPGPVEFMPMEVEPVEAELIDEVMDRDEEEDVVEFAEVIFD